jgi:hypothetical protein
MLSYESMNRAALGLILMSLVSGCSSKADIPEAKCLVFTTWNSHKITTWVNDEPVLVCDSVYGGYNKPFWPMLHRGLNHIHFTAERLPREKTRVLRESSDPFHVLPTDGSTTVKLIAGSMIFRPKEVKELLVWKTTRDAETSPHWSVWSDVSFRPPLDRYDDIDGIDEKVRTQIKGFLVRLKEALKSRDLAIAGLEKADFDDIAREAGIKADVSKAFANEPYYVDVAPIEKLNIIHGKKTIMAYRPDGKPIFHAGDDPDAPIEKHKLQMFYSIEMDGLYFVMEKGKLQPLGVRRY